VRPAAAPPEVLEPYRRTAIDSHTDKSGSGAGGAGAAGAASSAFGRSTAKAAAPLGASGRP
jgi:hypothetical protein